MDLNKIATTDASVQASNNVEEKIDITTMEEAFARTLKVGTYTFRIKQGLKGKALFNLVHKFGFSDKIQENLDPASMSKAIFDQFGGEFDEALSYMEYSIDGIKFYPLVINGVYQVNLVETNIQLMYKLLLFIYEAIVLFTEISQRQLDDMK